MLIILVLMQNNIGKREIFAEGMGGYWKEVPYKEKKSEFTQNPLRFTS